MRLSGQQVRLASVALLALACAGCTSPAPAPSASPESSARATHSAPPEPVALPPIERGQYLPGAEASVVSTSLDAPWSIVELRDGVLLVSERDTGVVKEVLSDGSAGAVGTVPGVAAAGEGGLMGLAVLEDGDARYLYAYFTASNDNRIVRMSLTGTRGSFSLGGVEDVLTGIPKASNHNGGRIAFGPDGMLYATTGDASRAQIAQDPASLGGKILRMTPTGGVPADNPIPGSYTYSYGHRNPQGIAWDADGTLCAAEFGQNTWDELNRIEPGANYGWPEVEGISNDDRFVNPVHQWSTTQASPSGLAIRGDTAFLAALRGERLWAIDLTNPNEAAGHFVEEYGRIRDVLVASDGSLLFLTNNTDGRGSPFPGDDHLLRVPLAAAS